VAAEGKRVDDIRVRIPTRNALLEMNVVCLLERSGEGGLNCFMVHRVGC
jgi:hypothetical protein